MEAIMRGERPAGAELQRVKAKFLKPNPFRDLERYPVQRRKIDTLRESMRQTGAWPNLVARPATGKGVELAYGHNRRAAFIEEFGEEAEIDILVMELSDDLMMKMMARENDAEYATSAQAEQETVRACVLAYAEGRITLPAVDPKTKKSTIRYAPSFVPDDPRLVSEHPYSAETIGQYLGWTYPRGEVHDKVHSALAALQYIEEGLVSESKFDGLTTTQAKAAIDEGKRARFYRETLAKEEEREAEKRAREAADAKKRADEEARKIAEAAERHARQQAATHREEGRKAASRVIREVTDQLKAGKIGYQQARKVAAKIDPRPDNKPPPNINQYVRQTADMIGKFARSDDVAERITRLLPWLDQIDDHERDELVATLRQTAKRLEATAETIATRVQKDVTKMPARLPAA
jgi:hypothetical protein